MIALVFWYCTFFSSNVIFLKCGTSLWDPKSRTIQYPLVNMEPQNGGFEDDFPFQTGDFQGPFFIFRGVGSKVLKPFVGPSFRAKPMVPASTPMPPTCQICQTLGDMSERAAQMGSPCAKNTRILFGFQKSYTFQIFGNLMCVC